MPQFISDIQSLSPRPQTVVKSIVIAMAAVFIWTMVTASVDSRWALILCIYFWFAHAGEVRIALPEPVRGVSVRSFVREFAVMYGEMMLQIFRRQLINRTVILALLIIVGAEEFARRTPTQTNEAGAVMAVALLWLIADQMILGCTSFLSFTTEKRAD